MHGIKAPRMIGRTTTTSRVVLAVGFEVDDAMFLVYFPLL